MTNPTLANLGTRVKKHRGDKTLREAAKEIGIGPATLMRVETGRVPDVDTFGKLCRWLNVDPGVFLGFTPQQTTRPTSSSSAALVVSAHLRADSTQSPETAQALARMILLATSRQIPKETNETDVDS